MSDSSVGAEIWSGALAQGLQSPARQIALRFRAQASRNFSTALCCLMWLAVSTQPLNVQRLPPGKPATHRLAERPSLDSPSGGFASFVREGRPVRPAARESKAAPDQNDADRLFGTARGTLMEIIRPIFAPGEGGLVERLDAGLCLGFVIMALGTRKLLAFAYRSTAIGTSSENSSLDPPAERRREPRVRTRYRHGVLYDGYKLVGDCAVIDRSPHGARIRTSRGLPDYQQLRFFDTYERVLYEARVAWQKDGDAGLELTRLFRIRS